MGFAPFGRGDGVVDVLGTTVDATAVELGRSTGGVSVMSRLGGPVPTLELSGGMVVLMVPATEREIVASVLPATFFALQL